MATLPRINIVLLASGLLALSLTPGCTRWLARPGKQITTPGGGDPVLTTAELNRLEAAKKGAVAARSAGHSEPRPLPSTIAQASFQRPIEPQPLKPFDTWSEPDAAAQALGLIGRPAVAELAAATQSPLPDRRLKAVQTLGRIGPEAAPAVSQLVPLLDDPDPQVRKAAIRTLGQIGPAAKDAVPALVQTLLEERSESR